MLRKFVEWFHAQVLPARWVPARALIGLMMFTGCWCSYMCRLQMPILAVPMIHSAKDSDVVGGACNPASIKPTVAATTTTTSTTKAPVAGGQPPRVRRIWMNPDELLHDIAASEDWGRRVKRQATTTTTTTTQVPPPKKRELGDLFTGEPFDWTPDTRGQLLAAYAYGNVPGNLLGGLFALKFGARRTIFWTSLISALVSIISPFLANIHWGALLASRVVVGLAGGMIFPACHDLVAKWSPPDEKARFVWSLLGGTFGTIFTYPMIAAIAENVNWECAWYIPSLLMLVWVVFWWLLAYDSPNEHPGITDEEKNYIINSQAGTVHAEKAGLKDTPLLAIFTSIPFISLVILHFGNLFLLFFYQNGMMIYLTKALGLQFTKGGFLAGLPWFARMAFGYFFSWGGDIVKRRQIVSLTTFRKSATFFSHFLPGVCLVMVGYVGCSEWKANTFLFFALGFNGAAAISNLSNNQDLSPNYAGLLYGIMNTVGTTTGMIIPPMVEAIAGKYGNPIDKWQILFWIGAAVCIVAMVIFVLTGSAKIQPWNEGKKPTA